MAVDKTEDVFHFPTVQYLGGHSTDRELAHQRGRGPLQATHWRAFLRCFGCCSE